MTMCRASEADRKSFVLDKKNIKGCFFISKLEEI